MLALRLLATYANLPVIGSSAISVLLPPALPSRPRGFLLQAKTPLGRTTCPSCNNRCADGGHKVCAYTLTRSRSSCSATNRRSWIATGTPCSREEARRRPAAGSSTGSVCVGKSFPILDELMRDKDPARSKRVTDALLRMVKLDIAALEKAYRS